MEVRERMYDQSHKSVIFLRKAQWRPVSETMLIHRDPLGAALSMGRIYIYKVRWMNLDKPPRIRGEE